MTDVQDWLDEGRALAGQATQGPWEARSSEATMNDRSEWKIGKHNRPQVLRSVMRGDDATFIADARTRLPQALAVIQAVLDLHRRDRYGGCAHTACNSGSAWPCPTVEMIQDALGAES